MNLKTKYLLILFLPILFALYLFTTDINMPYVGPNASDFNLMSLASRNFINFGFFNLKFAPVVELTKNLPQNPAFYLHHPPLTVYIETFLFKIFGDGFWVGRLAKVLPAFLILPVIYFIGKELNDKKFAVLSLFIASLVPTTVVFGKITFQGPWTLLFITLTSYFSLKYIRTKNEKNFYLALIAVILGTLCDWPMTYFTPFLFPLFLKHKKWRKGLILIATSTVTAILFLFYAYLVLGNFNNLIASILNRSVGSLLFSLSLWPLRWSLLLIIRFIIYFNPIFVILSLFYLIIFVRKLLVKKLDNIDLLLFAYFSCGIANIILFPEGSFGHPFWIYILTPFIVFASARIILDNLIKFKFLVLAVLFFSIIYALRIQDWKYQQDASNLFRYILAKAVSPYLIPYDTIIVNPGSYVDSDLYAYAFYQNVKEVLAIPQNQNKLKNANFYVFSCIGCNLNTPEINYLAKLYAFRTYGSPPARVYIFFLKEKQTAEIPDPIISESKMVQNQVVPKKESLLRSTYNYLINFLKAPQI